MGTGGKFPYFSKLLNVSAHTSLAVGCNSSGSEDTWGDLCSYHSRKQQDDSFGSDRPYGSISIVLINQEPSQQHSQGSLRQRRSYSIPCYSKKSVLSYVPMCVDKLI